jgi:WD40 repeat protein
VTDNSGALNLFDPSGALTATTPGHSYWPRGIAVSPDGSRLATGDTRSVILWNTSDWSQVWTLQQPIDALDFDPTGQVLVGCCQYALRDEGPKAASIIDVKSAKVVREVIVEGYRIKHARYSPDGLHLACAMRKDCEGYARTDVSALVEVESGNVLQKLKAEFEQVRDFAFLPHRNEIAVAVFGHTRRPLVLWQVPIS